MSKEAAPSGRPVARIDLDALVHNYRQVIELVGRETDVVAMVKADAYGHGAAPVAAALEEAGCRRFGVATIEEGAQLKRDRQLGGPRVAVFGGLLAAEAEAALAHDLEVVVSDGDVVRALSERAAAGSRTAAIHLKVDTGLTRLGVAPADAVELARRIDALPGVRLASLCSHFAEAESVTGAVTAGQLECLVDVATAVRAAGIDVPERHIANSSGILTRPETHLEAVRPGLMLYGLYPDPSLGDRASLRPVMTFEARVVRVADVPAGRGVSYAHTYRTHAPARLATVRVGYADGYPRHLSGCGVVRVGGVEAPVRGRVCMDQTVVDVTGLDGVAVGDPVELWGAGLGAERVAALAGTISYELVARVGARAVRRYEGRSADGSREDER